MLDDSSMEVQEQAAASTSMSRFFVVSRLRHGFPRDLAGGSRGVHRGVQEFKRPGLQNKDCIELRFALHPPERTATSYS